MRLTLLVFVGPALAAAVVLGAVAVVGLDPVRPSRPAGLAWDGRTFTTEAQFRAWLRSHGRSYRSWAAHHPGAAPWQPRHAEGQRLAPVKHGKRTHVLSPAARIIAASLLGVLGLGIALRRVLRRLVSATRRRVPRPDVVVYAGVGGAARAFGGMRRRRRGGELGGARRDAIAVYAAVSVFAVAVGAAIPLLLR